MSSADFLVEIGTEELPPKALKTLAAAFHQGIVDGLQKAGLSFKDSESYAAPRRLAVLIHDLQLTQPDRDSQRRGPALNAAFRDDGCPTPAAEGFARSCGVSVEDLDRLETDKGAWLAYTVHEKGRPAAELVPPVVEASLARLPVPKRMRWGDLDAEFVRPVHWVVMLLGDQVLDTRILGVRSGRETFGHRFHHPGSLHLAEPRAYAPLLESEGHVLPEFNRRREAVRAQVLEAAAAAGGNAVIDEDLLDEVTSMVEWPRSITGRFDEAFLDVPAEALISAMKNHQKYFHLLDGDGRLMPIFITVANIDSKDPAQVQAGNERVIRPRLADAAFFWNQDRKQALSAHQQRLSDVVFQNKLGTVAEKCERVAKLAQWLGEQLNLDRNQCRGAAILSKADLMTEMVGEFPELQGIMGRYYALHSGIDDEVAAAIEQHYQPRFAGDDIAAGGIGRVLAIADKTDTLVGIFGIGQTPSGDKDPFGLRRAALGVLRTLIEGGVDIDLMALLQLSVAGFDKRLTERKTEQQVFSFMMERLRTYYDDQGLAPDSFDAVLAQQPVSPLDFDRRIQAVSKFRELPEAAALAAANKRISNIIIKQAGELKIPERPDPALFESEEEKALATQVADMEKRVQPLFAAGDYVGALTQLAQLREVVDRFFDTVMVMAEDEKLRLNRLSLLTRLRNLFLHSADLSRLQG